MRKTRQNPGLTYEQRLDNISEALSVIHEMQETLAQMKADGIDDHRVYLLESVIKILRSRKLNVRDMMEFERAKAIIRVYKESHRKGHASK